MRNLHFLYFGLKLYLKKNDFALSICSFFGAMILHLGCMLESPPGSLKRQARLMLHERFRFARALGLERDEKQHGSEEGIGNCSGINRHSEA